MANPTAALQEALPARLIRRRRDVAGVLFQVVTSLSLVLALFILLVLVFDMFNEGWSVFADRGTDFLRSPLSRTASTAGVAQGIVGSLLIAFSVAVLAFPIGIGAAVYLEEYARQGRLHRLVNTNIRNLAGVPSIVYGILGLTIFVKTLRPITGGRSVIAAGVTMAILVLPLVVITAQEAIRAVPGGIREAAFGVGATRWEVVRSHVLPSAAPGILTGTILSLSRAVGETAPLILVGGITGFLSTGDQNFFEQLRGSFTALPLIIFGWSRERPDFRPLTAAAILVLLAVVLLVNALAIMLRNRYERRW